MYLVDISAIWLHIKVAYTSGPIFEKIMKRYPISSVHKNHYQIDQRHELW